MAVRGTFVSSGLITLPEMSDCRKARINGTSNIERDSHI